MDLYAYLKIGDLEKLAETSGIEVPRLRGYRLMSEEKAVSEENIATAIKKHSLYLCERACTSCPRFRPNSDTSEFSWSTYKLKEKYCIYREEVEEYEGEKYTSKIIVGFRWDLVHGKNKKAIKFAIKKAEKSMKRQFETFNKYAGKSNVLYIRARIGGDNWNYYGGQELCKKPWFIEKVDDYFDDTYCDIYAKIGD